MYYKAYCGVHTCKRTHLFRMGKLHGSTARLHAACWLRGERWYVPTNPPPVTVYFTNVVYPYRAANRARVRAVFRHVIMFMYVYAPLRCKCRRRRHMRLIIKRNLRPRGKSVDFECIQPQCRLSAALKSSQAGAGGMAVPRPRPAPWQRLTQPAACRCRDASQPARATPVCRAAARPPPPPTSTGRHRSERRPTVVLARPRAARPAPPGMCYREACMQPHTSRTHAPHEHEHDRMFV